MKRRDALKLGLASPLCLTLGREPASAIDDAVASRTAKSATGYQVAATVSPYASEAAKQMFEQGGNAIDAVAAAAMALSVVDGHNSGIGGGCLLLIRQSDGSILAVDGRETAPQLAHRDMFIRDGRVDAMASQTGPLAVGVPGFVAALHATHEKLGKLRWPDVLSPAMILAREGFQVGPALASAIRSERSDLVKFASSAEILLRDGNEPLRPGDRLIQSHLADTIEHLAQDGPEWFYRGAFSKAACEFLASLGGIVQPSDFERYQVRFREPIESRYRSFRVRGFTPPS